MSENLATAERLNAEAETEHQAAADKEMSINARLKDTADRMASISQRRINGESNDQEASEFAALKGDADLLQKMLAEAKQITIDAFGKLRLSVMNFNDLGAEHKREQNAIEYQVLLCKAKEIEDVFVRAIGETGRAGKKIGHFTLGQSFRVGDALDRALRLNVIPPIKN